VILGFSPLGSGALGAYVPHGFVPTTVGLLYVVGGLGWAVNGGLWDYPPGTLIDTTLPQYQFLVGEGPPIDALPLNQYTYDFMTSNGVNGCGYTYYRVAVSPGIVPVGPPFPGWDHIE
jgi:hypothetical protein